MSRLFYVIGNPIEHSLSPMIHAFFAEETGIDIVYRKQRFEAEDFAGQMKALLASERVVGANVTVPFKTDAARFADSLTQRARHAGAVNTLVFDSSSGILGDNTDGIGFVRDVEVRFGIDLSDARILILGAGGAARGLLAALIDRTKQITTANRTDLRAKELASEFGLSAMSLQETAHGAWDIVVNATSASLQKTVPAVAESALAQAQLCYDLMYSKQPTPFMEKALKAGCPKVADGLGMLLEQAAESFRLWNGVLPSTNLVYTRLKELG